MSADPTWVAEMTRRRKLALSYFHPRLHSPETAALRRSRDVVWDRRLGVYLFPDRETLDRCRAAGVSCPFSGAMACSRMRMRWPRR